MEPHGHMTLYSTVHDKQNIYATLSRLQVARAALSLPGFNMTTLEKTTQICKRLQYEKTASTFQSYDKYTFLEWHSFVLL